MTPTRAAQNTRQDRIIRVMVVVTCVLVAAGFGIGVATIWQVTGQGSTLDAQARSDEITGCRSSWNTELISAPQTKALQALALGDDETLEEAAREADPDRFAELSVLARTDPDAFLALCREEKPGEGQDSPGSVPTSTVPGPPYSGCAEVQRAGNDPLMRGEPGYTAGPDGLDGNSDGVACE